MKIHLMGASGTGVTTLGRSLALALNIPYFDSDDYFWLASDPPFTFRRPVEERNAMITTDLAAYSSWILGGSVVHWGQGTFPPFDLVVFLRLPLELRMERLHVREEGLYGGELYENPDRLEKFTAFMDWARDYDLQTGLANRTLKVHLDWLLGLECRILRMEGDLTTSQRMQRVMEELGRMGK